VSENNVVRKITAADQIYDRAGNKSKPMVQNMKFIKKINKFSGSRTPEFQNPQTKYHKCTIFLADKVQSFKKHILLKTVYLLNFIAVFRLDSFNFIYPTATFLRAKK
jgi:hypothetical protein